MMPRSSSSNSSFFEKLLQRCTEINSYLCIGLDPHPSEIENYYELSEEERCVKVLEFCKELIDATHPHAAAYKPNGAFFESLGVNFGSKTLLSVMKYIPSNIPVLLDVKRGDIGTTAVAYAEACYDHLGADAVTLSPLMGYDSVQPFVSGKYSGKGAFLICKTSNPGSNDLFTLPLLEMQKNGAPMLLYERIAQLATNQWSSTSNNSAPDYGLVVGATDPVALAKIRAIAGPNVWILAPGIGAQGGDLIKAVAAGFNDQGTHMLIPISRGISRAADPGAAAEEYKNCINTAIRDRPRTCTNETDALSVNNDISKYQRDFIEFCLSKKVLRFGSFTLKSGRTSPYFFNAGLFDCGQSLFMLGKAYAASIVTSKILCDESLGKFNVSFDVIFGPAYKGISLGAVVSSALYAEYGVNVGYAYNRKEAKDHGEKGVLVGANMENKRVLIIDDVITAGTAIRESFNLLKSVHATPVGVSIALDRMEKVSLEDPSSATQAIMRDFSIPVLSIISLPQLQTFLSFNSSYDSEVLDSIVAYREQYGV